MSGVSVVLCTRDRPTLLADALDALAKCIRSEDEVVVVDSASRDSTVQRVIDAAHVRGVRLEIPGVSRARNAGTAASTKPIIAFTDDDCLPDPGWTKAIEQAFTEDPAIGFLTGRIVADRPRRLHLSTMLSEERRRLTRGVDLDT